MWHTYTNFIVDILKGNAAEVYCSARAWIFMNEWNRIPIEWHSDAPPRARGWSCLCPARSVASTNLLASGWMNGLTNLCRDRRPFCWNVRLIWQYFVDRRKANAWTWSLMMDFLLTCQLMSYASSNREFCNMNCWGTSRISRNPVAR